MSSVGIFRDGAFQIPRKLAAAFLTSTEGYFLDVLSPVAIEGKSGGELANSSSPDCILQIPHTVPKE